MGVRLWGNRVKVDMTTLVAFRPQSLYGVLGGFESSMDDRLELGRDGCLDWASVGKRVSAGVLIAILLVLRHLQGR